MGHGGAVAAAAAAADVFSMKLMVTPLIPESKQFLRT